MPIPISFIAVAAEEYGLVMVLADHLLFATISCVPIPCCGCMKGAPTPSSAWPATGLAAMLGVRR